MQAKQTAPFGTWPSPVTADMVTGKTVSFSELAVDGEAVFWLELRPNEGGRRALVRWMPGGEIADALPADADVGTRVHEYGGGAYAATGGRIVYSQRSTGNVMSFEDGTSRTLVAVEGCRYAGFTIDARRGLVYAVREDHRDRPPTDPVNALVAIALDPNVDPQENAGTIVAAGFDFYLEPQLSPAADRLAWIAWNRPDMPWDATQLFVADLTPGGAAGGIRCVAGDAGRESIVEAHWSPDGVLTFSSDRTNWWNLYAVRDGEIEALAPAGAEIGSPPWVFGHPMFAPIGGDRCICAFVRNGIIHAGFVENATLHELPFGPVDSTPLAYNGGAVFLSVPTSAASAIAYVRDLDDTVPQILRSATTHALDILDVSIGESITIPTSDGETTQFFFYPPRNANYDGIPGTQPPLVVMSHGGPTAMHTNGFGLSVQWWTSRGFAVAHVNYRGSTGFGRAYRERLNGNWGVVDVDDCIDVARWLAANGRCDPANIAIRGGSASGMTALLAVARSDVFRAATSLYGVMELEVLAAETHKFEARYVDGLIGPLPAMRDRYIERSPLHNVATISVPVLLFQGLDDHAVPPNQASLMREALLARGVAVTHIEFPGEGHGFRQAENVQRVLETELAFYRDVFGLTA